MLVEFTRVAMAQSQTPEGASGEDDGLETAPAAIELMLAVNPLLVSAVTPLQQNPNFTVIKLGDGRGYAVREAYREVMSRLEAGSIGARQPH